MGKRLKGKIVWSLLFVIVIVIVIVGTILVNNVGGRTLRKNRYYVWGFNSNLLNISPGQIITEVKFIFKGLTHQNDNSSAKLEIFLVNNPNLSQGVQKSFITNIGDIIGDDAINGPNPAPPKRKGITLVKSTGWGSPILSYQDNTPGKEDVILRLSNVNNPESWVWDVFDQPFNFALSTADPNIPDIVSFTSGLLEFIDYMGNGTGAGILIDPAGNGYFEIDDIIMEITIKNFEGEPATITQTISVDFAVDNRPPYIL